MGNKKLIIGVLSVVYLVSCNNVKQQKVSENKEINEIQTKEKMENLKSIAKNAQDAFFTDYSEEGVKKYFKTDYIQHNPHVPTGIDPVIGFLPVLKEANTTYSNHRLLQDGEFIIFHNSYHNAEAFGAKEVVAFDVWRMEKLQNIGII